MLRKNEFINDLDCVPERSATATKISFLLWIPNPRPSNPANALDKKVDAKEL